MEALLDQSASPLGRLRSYRWVALLLLLIGIAGVAYWAGSQQAQVLKSEQMSNQIDAPAPTPEREVPATRPEMTAQELKLAEEQKEIPHPEALAPANAQPPAASPAPAQPVIHRTAGSEERVKAQLLPKAATPKKIVPLLAIQPARQEKRTPREEIVLEGEGLKVSEIPPQTLALFTDYDQEGVALHPTEGQLKAMPRLRKWIFEVHLSQMQGLQRFLRNGTPVSTWNTQPGFGVSLAHRIRPKWEVGLEFEVADVWVNPYSDAQGTFLDFYGPSTELGLLVRHHLKGDKRSRWNPYALLGVSFNRVELNAIQGIVEQNYPVDPSQADGPASLAQASSWFRLPSSKQSNYETQDPAYFVEVAFNTAMFAESNLNSQVGLGIDFRLLQGLFLNVESSVNGSLPLSGSNMAFAVDYGTQNLVSGQFHYPVFFRHQIGLKYAF
ncbi:MAG: hypothetical protein AAFP92_05240 [Bacteroidota bacterium]